MNHSKFKWTALTALLIAGFVANVQAFDFKPTRAQRGETASATVVVPTSGSLELGFSPEGSARALVLKLIQSAQPGTDIRMMAYGLSARDVVAALIERRKAGVRVAVVADYEANLTGRGRAAGLAALTNLVQGGVAVRTISVYPIMHDKVIIAGDSVEWGSFNYSYAAEMSNSETATVAWNSPALARVMAQHWLSRWEQGVDFSGN